MTIKRKSAVGMQRVLAFGVITGIALGTSSCIQDPDCGVCDPDNLVLESISGVNYASKQVHVLSPQCEGERCPDEFDKGTYFTETLGPCEQSEEALELATEEQRREYCRISPLVTAFGIEFVFNNLLEPSSIELVRKRPDNPNLFEVYDWKPDVLEIQGPITRYNGDYTVGEGDAPDVVTRLVNLSCIDNLAAAGEDFNNESYEDVANNPCNRVEDGVPLKMFMDGFVRSYRGTWTNGTNSCSSPQEGPDTCCSECDYLLTTRVSKYGLTQPLPFDAALPENREVERTPNVTDGARAAIACDAQDGDKYIECEDFIPFVDRTLEEQTWSYYWDCEQGSDGCEAGRFPVPEFDRLRETHPERRPAWLLNTTARCTSTGQCRDPQGQNLPGTECVGHIDGDESQACSPDRTEGCIEGRCVPEWFVTCAADPNTTGGEQAYCQDKRFSNQGTAACWVGTTEWNALCDEVTGECAGPANPNRSPARPLEDGVRLAYCDANENGLISGLECCQDELGGPADTCDPYYQTSVAPIGVYDRDENLPEPTRNCLCEELDASDPDLSDREREAIEEKIDQCTEVIDLGCRDENGNIRPDRLGQHAIRFVDRFGGVVYDPAIKGVEFRPADVGNIQRGSVEECAEARNLIDNRNRHDGWRANDAFAPENYEDFDRAMCSGQTYTVRFADPESGGPYIEDKVGNTMAGKNEYTFTTPQFHVVPDSGFPTENLRIGACDQFAVRFSNKYDMSPENLKKLQLFRVECTEQSVDGEMVRECEPTTPNDRCDQVGPVAGGEGCVDTDDDLQNRDDPCARPCLVVDVQNQITGEVRVQIDPTEFGKILENNSVYRLVIPTAGSLEDALNDPAVYRDVFWDVCGMPLVAEHAIPYSYDFTIDRPKCKEDADRDDVQLSCDNAANFFNPDQQDMDGDGIGDVIDLCPTVPGASTNSADSDKDGVGNECDNCRQAQKQYNNLDLGLPAYMEVRNVPFQGDADFDGIGDVCDNCVLVANCEDFDENTTWAPGDPIAFDDRNVCQRDDNEDMVGDACAAAAPAEGAAGPVGLGPDDDFDQDGVGNEIDGCPRQPLPERVTCEEDLDCPANADLAEGEGIKQTCVAGVCNHLDSDGDSVGDICDTCAFRFNPEQVMEGGMQEDDLDGDFVGSQCETNAACANRKDPRPFSFYEVAANGNCCTVAIVTGTEEQCATEGVESPCLVNAQTLNVLLAPTLPDEPKIPLRVECSDAEIDSLRCQRLPPAVATTPGILEPPPGCEAALTAAGVDALTNPRLTDLDFGGDFAALWGKACFLPQFDQDFDGYGEPCDLCPFDFDPENLQYVDATGRVWPTDGRFCNGDYDIENRCEADEPTETGGSDGGSDGGSSGGGDETGGETGGEGGSSGG